MRHIDRFMALGLAAVVLPGCALVSPYDQTFMCEESDDYGRCQSVKQAYDDAVGGAAPDGPAVEEEPSDVPRGPESGGVQHGPRRTRTARSGAPQAAEVATTADGGDARRVYRSNQYRELSGLIEAPVTPVLKPANVMRTLILSYPAGSTLYMPRYIFFVADEPQFVLGDYLDGVTEDAPTIYPNGHPQ